ncbi:helix-turn-helix domain-containing protein [Gorillibacterium timonense]|uniref:helix-turn-helix domain-containing protein n=1 Tax=Gorillibacterium timonense TaxID=1689269 RepID=UPI00071D4345|nr:helix-turn-helix transcriptional regulator [Gorillibacterium timonense]
MNYYELGTRIRAERHKLGLTLEKLSEIVGISEPYLGHIERGERKLSVETLIKLASGVTVDSLVQDSVNIEQDVEENQLIHLTKRLTPKQKRMVVDLVRALLPHLENES